jgi:hypothetical protein
MSEHEELPLNTSAVAKKKPGPQPGTRKASGAQSKANVAAANNSLGNLSREQVAHGEGRAPRRSMSGLDLNLYFAAKYTSNKNFYYRIFIEDGRGRIEKALAAYYDFVLDENGAKLSAQSGNKKMYLMALDKTYREEDDKLKQKQHNATLRTEKSKKLDVEGLEDSEYEDSKSRESVDRFSS